MQGMGRSSGMRLGKERIISEKDILVLLISYKDDYGRRGWEARLGGFCRKTTKMSQAKSLVQGPRGR